MSGATDQLKGDIYRLIIALESVLPLAKRTFCDRRDSLVIGDAEAAAATGRVMLANLDKKLDDITAEANQHILETFESVMVKVDKCVDELEDARNTWQEMGRV